MKVLVEIDYAGEVQARTVGYRGQDWAIIVPLMATAVASAMRRAQERRELAGELVQRGADAVVTSDVVVLAEPAPPDPPPSVDDMDRVRAAALRMLDDGMLAEVIADELGVSAGQVRRWDRGDR